MGQCTAPYLHRLAGAVAAALVMGLVFWAGPGSVVSSSNTAAAAVDAVGEGTALAVGDHDPGDVMGPAAVTPEVLANLPNSVVAKLPLGVLAVGADGGAPGTPQRSVPMSGDDSSDGRSILGLDDAAPRAPPAHLDR